MVFLNVGVGDGTSWRWGHPARVGACLGHGVGDSKGQRRFQAGSRALALSSATLWSSGVRGGMPCMACKGAGVQIPSAPLSISAGRTVLTIPYGASRPAGSPIRSPHWISRRRSPRRQSHRVLAQRDQRRPHYLRRHPGRHQAAPADAHVRLIGRVSSAWWCPGMRLMTNGP
jgi:hypothetical protein